jgi:putative PEP-CTERM system TPR-repeat lipoprotein
VLQLAGEVAIANGDVREAARYFQRASERDPKNIPVRVRLSQARLATGETERGIEGLEAAARIDEGDYRADVALVTLHLNRREVDKALVAAQALEHKQPQNPLTHNLMGLVLLAKQDQVKARARFEQALALEPLYLPAAHNLALLDRRDGKVDAARQRYEAILVRDPRHEQALIALAQHLQQTEARAAEVEGVIDRAVAGNPASVRAHLLKIGYLLGRGDAKRALAAAQQAQAALPENRLVLSALGRAQLAAGESDQAIATFGKLSAMVPRATGFLLAQAEAFAAAQA